MQNKVTIDDGLKRDIINIATKAYTPILGFLKEKDLDSVVKNMAIKINSLLNNRELMYQLSTDGRLEVEKKLNWEKICQSYSDVFGFGTE